ncbi:STAS domain-containing protein [Streptomyces venezuelae]|uniref:STAS domain-containing protein n=1 Tax=Streptomyces venezuelae TaxID=54571 RepID=UPI00278C2EFF|nr:STAS domain-containing protein [Streptomyces venezuelae]
MTTDVTPDGTLLVSGEIDAATGSALLRALTDALRAHPGGVALDLSAVTFCDCAGLRSLLAARYQHLDLGRRPLRVVAAGPRMTRLLQLTGTGWLFEEPMAGRVQ